MTRTGKDIKNVVVHCTAGFGDIASIRRFWRSMGWRTDGYHLFVDLDGTITQLVPFNLPSNGVKGFNGISINISYRGGVDRNNVNKSVDTRTPEQKQALIVAIERALQWIIDTGGNLANVRVLGHRDFSPDQNGNGVIDTWERIKECPSFDAIPEYKDVIKNFLSNHKTSIEYVVRPEDTLYKIATLHKVTLAQLRQLNNLSTDKVVVGQRLKIK